MRCVQVDLSGHVVDVSPQPDDVTTCPMVIVSGAEAVGSPFRLTLEEGGMIGGAVVLLWGAAFGLRALRRALDVG
jgi:hypothetical protein